MKNCIECPHHFLLPDPDPHDWFCDDDVKVVCGRTSIILTVACRPYNTEKETTPPPRWCPLKKVK